MKYPLAEKFKALQGEGVYSGTPMAFLRMIGCSVGQKICTSCDTDFLHMVPGLGGGVFEIPELLEFVGDYAHVCISGGEPFDRDLEPLVHALLEKDEVLQVHIETSGTKPIPWDIACESPDVWICVSPKPGYLLENIEKANEIKVIYPGLGDGPGWPTVQDAVRWSQSGTPVFLQPRNFRNELDNVRLKEVEAIVKANPTLRLSMQIHKFLGSR